MACTAFLGGCSGKTSGTSSAAGSAAGSSAAVSTAGGGQTYTFRYSEIQAPTHPASKADAKFAELVKEKSNGRINIQVYYNAQLGDEKSGVEQVQYGGLDFTRASLSVLSEFDKELNILSLPYLFSSSDQMWKVLDGDIGKKFLNGISGSKMVGLSWFDAGARNFYTVKPVKTMADLKGKKIRVQESALMMDMVKALGASPTPMDYGEVYSALQNGVVDGAENNWPSYESTKHYEVARYLLEDGHSRLPEMQLISQKTWEKLSDGDKQILQDCASECSQVERQLWAESEKDSQAKVKAAGATITELSPDELKKFQDAMKPLYEKYAKDYMDTVNQIQATK
ncbi:TRAP transporter substrate-binding protein [Caproiciproducens sp. NJN-50]|nr:TRAP transporter substrate-binding protein [Caproiciproducens sp. NJN-50]